MIIILYNILIAMLGLYMLANAGAAYKFRKLNHPWGKIVADSYAGNALFAFCGVLTSGFGPRPASLVWWVVITALIGRVAMTAGMVRPTRLVFGLMKDVEDPEQANDRRD